MVEMPLAGILCCYLQIWFVHNSLHYNHSTICKMAIWRVDVGPVGTALARPNPPCCASLDGQDANGLKLSLLARRDWRTTLNCRKRCGKYGIPRLDNAYCIRIY